MWGLLRVRCRPLMSAPDLSTSMPATARSGGAKYHLSSGATLAAGSMAFVLSGFAGLLYESTFTRYLSILVGHAAYAQALVLAVFLGGLAIGAFATGRLLPRIRAPLIGYAIVEAILSLAAVYFHDLFVLVRGTVESAGAPAAWLASVLIILPQTVLLGATFPLLVAAVTKLAPKRAGAAIAWLYGANALGGVFGVLAVSFVLVHLIGLPGCMLAGAVASAAAGFVAWVMHHRTKAVDPTQERPAGRPLADADLILGVAFGTGMASLAYEVVWTRMLALVLGSSARAFEIMLATFIFGLACGSVLARRFIGRTSLKPILARVQLAMGAFALLAVFSYEWLFGLLVIARRTLPNTVAGYDLYALVCFGISLTVMILPTLCAGMTLPLLTRVAMRTAGDRGIAEVYAWNTLGAIVGVAVAVHVLLPQFGLRLGLAAAAAVDMALGLWLLARADRRLLFRGGVLAITALGAVLVHAPYDPLRLGSGIYRFLSFESNSSEEIFYRDGKTASVLVSQRISNQGARRSISTNGKPDASLALVPGQATGDELTTVMLGALPLLYRPTATRAVVIGFGAGLSTATLLRSSVLDEVATIEIEPAMVAGARTMGTKTAAAFEDPRSKIVYSDAKTYFGAQPPGSVDIIVSEPSNPWVSGVAGLYTKEHYRLMRKSLAEGGVLVQWLHMYESNTNMVASIFLALAAEFPNFQLFLFGADLLVIAWNQDVPPAPDALAGGYAELPALAQFLEGYGIASFVDLEAAQIPGSETFLPYVRSLGISPNSDYFPVLERYAELGFFLRSRNLLVAALSDGAVFFESEPLAGWQLRQAFAPVSRSSINSRQNSTALAQEVVLAAPGGLFDAALQEAGSLLPRGRKDVLTTTLASVCPDSNDARLQWIANLQVVWTSLARFLRGPEIARLWIRLEEELPCLKEVAAEPDYELWFNYVRAAATADFATLAEVANEILPEGIAGSVSEQEMILYLMLKELASGNYSNTSVLSAQLPKTMQPHISAVARIILALAYERYEQRYEQK